MLNSFSTFVSRNKTSIGLTILGGAGLTTAAFLTAPVTAAPLTVGSALSVPLVATGEAGIAVTAIRVTAKIVSGIGSMLTKKRKRDNAELNAKPSDEENKDAEKSEEVSNEQENADLMSADDKRSEIDSEEGTKPRKKRRRIMIESDEEKNDQEKYNEACAKTSKKVMQYMRKFHRCSKMTTSLTQLMVDARDAVFDLNGELAEKEQPVRNKLQILRWEEKSLRKLDKTARGKQEKLRNEIIEKAANKLETPSKKAFKI